MATIEWPESLVPSSRASALPASPVYRWKTVQKIFWDGYTIIMLETSDENAVQYGFIVASLLASFSY